MEARGLRCFRRSGKREAFERYLNQYQGYQKTFHSGLLLPRRRDFAFYAKKSTYEESAPALREISVRLNCS
jgi:hypothetical protein